MIIYGTKKTLDIYRLKLPDQFANPLMKQLITDTRKRQAGDPLYEWGAKVFQFEYLKCLQLCNFTSKFTIVIADVKEKQIDQLTEIIFGYLNDIYSGDQEMLKLIDRYAAENTVTYFDKLTDRSIISSMNYFQTSYMEDGDRFYDFVDGNLLRTRPLNKEINWNYLAGLKVHGKKTYDYPAERFAQLLKNRYQ